MDENNPSKSVVGQDKSSVSGKKREHNLVTGESSSPGASKPKPVLKNLSTIPDNTPSSSPPNKKLTSMKDLVEANDAAANLILCHEINLDDEFKLPEPNYHGNEDDPATMTGQEKLELAVKTAMHQAFWDSLSTDLTANPPVYNHAFVLLEEIKELFFSLLPADRVTTLHKRLIEGLDIDLLKQQSAHNALDIQSLTSFMIDTMAMMCAPVRDEEVAKLRSLDSIVDMFKGIYRVLGLMKRDFVNYSISSIRPLIQQQHIEYERKKFAEILAKLPDGLKTTEKWLRSCHEELRDDVELCTHVSPPGGSSSSPSLTVTPLTVLKRAYLRLLHWEEGKEFPETVLVDQTRFYQLQIELKRLLLVATALLTTFTSLKPDLASHQAFVTSLKEELFVLVKPAQIEKDLKGTLDGVAEQIFHKTSEYNKKLENPIDLSQETKQSFTKQIKSIEELNSHSVYRVLLKRAHQYLYASAEFAAQNKASVTSSALPSPPGLQIVSSELTSLASKYSKLVNLNQVVYGPFYVPILKEALDLSQSPSYAPMSLPQAQTEQDGSSNSARRKLDMDASKKSSPEN